MAKRSPDVHHRAPTRMACLHILKELPAGGTDRPRGAYLTPEVGAVNDFFRFVSILCRVAVGSTLNRLADGGMACLAERR